MHMRKRLSSEYFNKSAAFTSFTTTFRNAQKAEIESLEADIRKLARRRAGGEDDSDEERRTKKPKKSLLQQELDKYAKGRGLQKKGKDGKRKDEDDVIKALNNFRVKLKSTSTLAEEGGNAEAEDGDDGQDKDKTAGGEEDVGMEVDDDIGFMNHALRFPKDDGEESRKAERDYEVIDPRQRNARAKEEEREKRRGARGRGRGGRFRR
jgi:peptidyl-prolyl cis-trans isomerase SDCCAG10